MNIAITSWNRRVSPVFDAASSVAFFSRSEDGSLKRDDFLLPKESCFAKADFLERKKVKTLICGSISCGARQILASKEIEVLSFVSGEIDEVLQAWLQGKLSNTRYLMPGCRRHHGWRGGHGFRRQKK